MQHMVTGANLETNEGLRSLVDVVMAMNGPNTGGFDQIRPTGAPVRNSIFVSNATLTCRISGYRSRCQQDVNQDVQSSGMSKSATKIQDLEGHAPVASISSAISQKVKVKKYTKFCSEGLEQKSSDFAEPISLEIGQVPIICGYQLGGPSSTDLISKHHFSTFEHDFSTFELIFSTKQATKSMQLEGSHFGGSKTQGLSIGDINKGTTGSHGSHSELVWGENIQVEGEIEHVQNNSQRWPKSMQLEESHFWCSKIQGMSIGDINKGTTGSHGSHSERVWDENIQVEGEIEHVQNNTQCGPKSTQLEESHFGGSKIQGMSIGDINKGTIGSHGSHSERVWDENIQVEGEIEHVQNNTQCGPKSTQLEESHFGGSKIQGMSIGDINKGTIGSHGSHSKRVWDENIQVGGETEIENIQSKPTVVPLPELIIEIDANNNDAAISNTNVNSKATFICYSNVNHHGPLSPLFWPFSRFVWAGQFLCSPLLVACRWHFQVGTVVV